jgi:hypothetical protein
MSVLTTSARHRRRTAGRSVREVCLLGITSHGESEWRPGDAVTISERVYRVTAIDGRRPAQTDPFPCYVHLAGEEED